MGRGARRARVVSKGLDATDGFGYKAPEMLTRPIEPAPFKADVFSLAKTVWAVIVQKYKAKLQLKQGEKSQAIAPAVDNCPAHRTSLWTARATHRCGSCPPLPELEPTA
jgi:hypothetical protein